MSHIQQKLHDFGAMVTGLEHENEALRLQIGNLRTILRQFLAAADLEVYIDPDEGYIIEDMQSYLEFMEARQAATAALKRHGLGSPQDMLRNIELTKIALDQSAPIEARMIALLKLTQLDGYDKAERLAIERRNQ